MDCIKLRMADETKTHEQSAALTSVPRESSSGLKPNPERKGSKPGPEERETRDEHERQQNAFDKTIAESFNTSNPPSSVPDPGEDEAA